MNPLELHPLAVPQYYASDIEADLFISHDSNSSSDSAIFTQPEQREDDLGSSPETWLSASSTIAGNEEQQQQKQLQVLSDRMSALSAEMEMLRADNRELKTQAMQLVKLCAAMRTFYDHAHSREDQRFADLRADAKVEYGDMFYELARLRGDVAELHQALTKKALRRYAHNPKHPSPIDAANAIVLAAVGHRPKILNGNGGRIAGNSPTRQVNTKLTSPY